MEKLKAHFRHVMWEFKINKNALETKRNFVLFIAKMLLIIATFQIDLQSFALSHW